MSISERRIGGQINPETRKLVVVEESHMDSKTHSWIHNCGTPLTDYNFQEPIPPVTYCTQCENPPEEFPNT